MRLLLLSVFILLAPCCQGQPRGQGTTPPSHQLWSQLLARHVDSQGMVSYRGFIADRTELERYLTTLSQTPPDPEQWSRAEQLAYWINAYNAFTVKLIIENYPLKSIQDLHPTIKIPGISTVWHKKFFKIGGQESSLDEIEHQILRKQFNEPRIHFAINCASNSCPPLRAEAYTARQLEEQLEEQARNFINNPRYNQISSQRAELSKIFNWFGGDFTEKGSLIDYLNRYSKVPLRTNARLKYRDYDWALNEQ